MYRLEISVDDACQQIERLLDAHPSLLRDRSRLLLNSDLPAGWFAIVDKLCSDITQLFGPEGCENIVVRQIKEKFAALRFYYRLGEGEDLHVDVLSTDGHEHIVANVDAGSADLDHSEALRDLVAAACEASERACQECGQSAKRKNIRGYYTTLCDAHHAS